VQRDWPESGSALGESALKMHPGPAAHREYSCGSEHACTHGEEPEDEGSSSVQAQYGEDDHRPQQILATVRQPFVILPNHFADDGNLQKAVRHSNPAVLSNVLGLS
jgi:hypothetical protein